MHRNYTLIIGLALAALACNDDGGGDAEGGTDGGETTRFSVGVENIGPLYPYFTSGVFDTPVGAGAPGPLMPGQQYSVEFHAPPGTRLSFATMFVPSNDLFLAPDGEGIALFDDQGQPLSGDVTDQIQVWDAGTELDEDLGLGSEQAPSQPGPNSGAPDPDTSVRLASESYANVPEVSALVSATLTAGEGNLFTLTIDNLSNDQTLMRTDATTSAVPLAPGVFVVHRESDPLFVVGTDQRSAGLEALAEDGDPSALGDELAANQGIVTPLAPGIWLVNGEGKGLFAAGQPDMGLGLETLAEDGNHLVLLDSFTNDPELGGTNLGVFGGLYGDEVGALEPGVAFVFEIEAQPGDRLSFASMFVQSNDLFVAPPAEGIALFDGDGAPMSGDISAQLMLWDAGTEVNEYPGAGPNQAPRQSGPNTGPDEGGVVQPVADGFVYPEPSGVMRVTITPQ